MIRERIVVKTGDTTINIRVSYTLIPSASLDPGVSPSSLISGRLHILPHAPNWLASPTPILPPMNSRASDSLALKIVAGVTRGFALSAF